MNVCNKSGEDLGMIGMCFSNYSKSFSNSTMAQEEKRTKVVNVTTEDMFNEYLARTK